MACVACLSRSWLLARLAGGIEKVAMDSRGRRAADLLALPDAELASASGAADGRALADEAAGNGATRVFRSLEPAGVWAVCPHDPDWPAPLDDLEATAPRALLGRGDRALLGALGDGPCAAIVGARKASAYGREVATALAAELGGAGLPVISGLAYGVDAAAHRGALQGRGLTAAVLGSGPDVAYPVGERELARRVVSTGLVLSEMPPGFTPFRWSFPARNRIIAALASMTIVVEARERSGALITAGMAADLGRAVAAVPGPVTSALSGGTNALIADGAHVVRGAQDVLDALCGVGARSLPEPPPLEPPLAAVLEAVGSGAQTPDEVALRAELSGPEAASALARLELLGRVTADALGHYGARLD